MPVLVADRWNEAAIQCIIIKGLLESSKMLDFKETHTTQPQTHVIKEILMQITPH